MQPNHKKTKVCLAITKGVWGGAQEYVYTIATSLPQERFDVVVICGEGDALPNKLAEWGVRIIRLNSMQRDISVLKEIKSFFDLKNIIETEKPDVLHLNSSKMGLVGSIIGRMCHVPKIIFTAHGWASSESRPWIQKKFFALLHWKTILFSHTTIAVSEHTKNVMRGFPWIRHKIVVIHNGIPPFTPLDQSAAREKIQLMTGDRHVPTIWVGTISELHTNKGLDYLIRATQKLPDSVGVFVIGEGEERKNLTNLIQTLHVESKVHILGRIPDARTLLSAFDIFTLTSRKEGLPYTILEAGLAGLPVIASSVSGIPEIIENNTSGVLVTPGNINQIQNSLVQLIEHPETRRNLGENLRKTVTERFSQKEMIEKTIALYTN